MFDLSNRAPDDFARPGDASRKRSAELHGGGDNKKREKGCNRLFSRRQGSRWR